MTSAAEPLLDDAAVAEFLASNRDFFTRYPDLLSSLDVHHGTGGAASLLERQLEILRSRNTELNKQLSTVFANARNNDRTFTRIRALTLALMDTAAAADVDAVLGRHLVAGFQADHVVCYVRGWTSEAILAHLAGCGADDEPPWARLFDHAAPDCAVYRPEEYARLFPGAALGGPGSIALVPVRSSAVDAPDSLNAILAIGAADANHFVPDMGDIFLRYIGDALARTLTRLGIGSASGR